MCSISVTAVYLNMPIVFGGEGRLRKTMLVINVAPVPSPVPPSQRCALLFKAASCQPGAKMSDVFFFCQGPNCSLELPSKVKKNVQ